MCLLLHVFQEVFSLKISFDLHGMQLRWQELASTPSLIIIVTHGYSIYLRCVCVCYHILAVQAQIGGENKYRKLRQAWLSV